MLKVWGGKGESLRQEVEEPMEMSARNLRHIRGSRSKAGGSLMELICLPSILVLHTLIKKFILLFWYGKAKLIPLVWE